MSTHRNVGWLEERADSALYAVSSKCGGGMSEIMDHFFTFLGRRTDFFSKNKPEECEKQLLKAFDRQCEQMDKIMRMKRQQREEADMRERKLLRQQIAMEKARKAAEEEKASKRDESAESVEKPESSGCLMPNEGNGCDLPIYKWTQTLDKIELSVPFNVDFALKSRDTVVEFKKTHLKVGIRGWESIIDGDLFGEIVVDDECTWSLEVEKKTVTVLMPKKRKNYFWSKLVVTDPEINIKN